MSSLDALIDELHGSSVLGEEFGDCDGGCEDGAGLVEAAWEVAGGGDVFPAIWGARSEVLGEFASVMSMEGILAGEGVFLGFLSLFIFQIDMGMVSV